MSERYWSRLSELLDSARSIAAASLRPNSTEAAVPNKGIPGVIAHEIQGRSFEITNGIVQGKIGDAEWISIWNFNKPGKFLVSGEDHSGELISAHIRGRCCLVIDPTRRKNPQGKSANERSESTC